MDWVSKHSVCWVVMILLINLSDPGHEKQHTTRKMQRYPTHFSWTNTSELTNISPFKEGSHVHAGRAWYLCYFSQPGSDILLRRIINSHHTLCLCDRESLYLKRINFRGSIFKVFRGNIFSLMREVRFAYLKGFYFMVQIIFNDF